VKETKIGEEPKGTGGLGSPAPERAGCEKGKIQRAADAASFEKMLEGREAQVICMARVGQGGLATARGN
jgi:hypothetical protein